jgi:DnaJ-class molecular chaperone
VGDLLVNVHIDVPKALTREQQMLVEKLAATFKKDEEQ